MMLKTSQKSCRILLWEKIVQQQKNSFSHDLFLEVLLIFEQKLTALTFWGIRKSFIKNLGIFLNSEATTKDRLFILKLKTKIVHGKTN